MIFSHIVQSRKHKRLIKSLKILYCICVQDVQKVLRNVSGNGYKLITYIITHVLLISQCQCNITDRIQYHTDSTIQYTNVSLQHLPHKYIYFCYI